MNPSITSRLAVEHQNELLGHAAERHRGHELEPRATLKAKLRMRQHPLTLRLHRLTAVLRAAIVPNGGASGARAPDGTPPGLEHSIMLRFAGDGDAAALARLATLDSSRPPAPPVLLALAAGEPRAALSLSEGTVVADPFRQTAELVELLQRRAEQLDGALRPRRWARRRSRSRRGFRSPTEPVLAPSIE